MLKRIAEVLGKSTDLAGEVKRRSWYEGERSNQLMYSLLFLLSLLPTLAEPRSSHLLPLFLQMVPWFHQFSKVKVSDFLLWNSTTQSQWTTTRSLTGVLFSISTEATLLQIHLLNPVPAMSLSVHITLTNICWTFVHRTLVNAELRWPWLCYLLNSSSAVFSIAQAPHLAFKAFCNTPQITFTTILFSTAKLEMLTTAWTCRALSCLWGPCGILSIPFFLSAPSSEVSLKYTYLLPQPPQSQRLPSALLMSQHGTTAQCLAWLTLVQMTHKARDSLGRKASYLSLTAQPSTLVELKKESRGSCTFHQCTIS